MRTALVAISLAVTTLALASETPVRTLYLETRASMPRWERSFTAIPLATPPASAASTHTAPVVDQLTVYLFVGDVTRTFDSGALQVDAAIMPTNNKLEMLAAYPTTQAALVRRISSDSMALGSLVQSAKTRAVGGMIMAIDTFPVMLWPKAAPTTPYGFPRYACFIATDEPDSGSINMRDLFSQRLIAKGIEGCLSWLDEKGAKSVVMPLIGSASGGTSALQLKDLKQRYLLQCRLINSISGIGLGVNGFLKHRKSIQEIGLIQWTRDMEKQFPAAPASPAGRHTKDVSANAVDQYGDFARTTLTKALSGKPVESGDLPKEDGCNSIFGFPKASGRG